jgi:hypothetical protein
MRIMAKISFLRVLNLNLIFLKKRKRKKKSGIIRNGTMKRINREKIKEKNL